MQLLTIPKSAANINLSLPHVATGRENPNSGLKAAFNAVFYCPPKTNTELVRVQNVMTGCYRRLSSLPVPEFGILTLFQSVAHSVRRINDGLQSNSGVSHMTSTNTQNPLTVTVSCIESQLIELSPIIGSIAESNSLFTQGLSQYIDSLDKPLSKITAVELAELINQYREAFSYPEISTPKTSRFNVLDKPKRLIAEHVTFDQAKQYRNATLKFACMSEGEFA